MDLKDYSTEQLEAELLRRKQEGATAYELEQCGGDFERGNPDGRCDGMGLLICLVCKWRSKESIERENEEYMYRRHHKKEWKKIKAKVIETGKIMMVDDEGIDGIYNMWHNDMDGYIYHDDELEFLEERLQKK